LDLVIVGAGGHASSVAETAAACGFNLIAFVDSVGARTNLLGKPIWPDLSTDYLDRGGIVALAIGDNSTREKVAWDVLANLPDRAVPALVHPSATVSRFASISAGSVVLQGAIVGSGSSVGRYCILNSGSQLDHDGVLEDFSSLAPGAILGGRVHVGKRSAVGIGAVIKHGISIGSDTVVGAASYVHCNLPDGVVAYGTPARIQRTRAVRDPYL